MTNNDNIVNLDAHKQRTALDAVDPNEVPEFIKPRGLCDMSDADQDLVIAQLRDRRMRAIQHISEQKAAKARIANASNRAKVEKKLAQVERAEKAVAEKLDKLEELLHQLRALNLQYE